MKKIVVFSLSLLSLPIFGVKPETEKAKLQWKQEKVHLNSVKFDTNCPYLDKQESDMEKNINKFKSNMVDYCQKKCSSFDYSHGPKKCAAHCVANHYFQYRDFLIRQHTNHCAGLPFGETFSYNPLDLDKLIHDSAKTKKAKQKWKENRKVRQCAKAHLAEFDRTSQSQKQEALSAVMNVMKIKALKQFEHEDFVYSLPWNPRGHHMPAPADDRKARFFDLEKSN